MNLKESIKQLMMLKDHQKFITNFARNKFNERFIEHDKSINIDTFMIYQDFYILSETVIRINYKYGVGEFEYSSNFDVDITEDIRNDSINNILDEKN